MSSDEHPPEQPLRLHRAAIATAAVDALRQNVLPLAAIAALTVFGDGVGVEALVRLAVYAMIATALAAVAGLVRWATTSYWLDEHAVHLRRGVVQRQHTALPIERISSIDSVQGPLHRAFGVIELQLQAAGGGQAPEITLGALSPERAGDLRSHAARVGEEHAAAEASQTPPLRTLARAELMLAAITSGQITVVLPVLAALSQTVDDLLGDDAAADLERYLVPDTVGAALLGLGVLLALAWALAIAGTIVAFAGFSVTRDEDRIRISRGLLQRRVSTIPVARIQAIRVVEGALRQPLGLAALRVESAGYAREQSVNTTLFPLLPRRAVDALVQATVPELAPAPGPLAPPPPRARWLYLGPPALAALAAAVPLAVVISGWTLLLVPLAPALGALRMRDAGWRIDGALLVARSRRLARTTIFAAASRLPERTFAQGPLARRLALASLAFALASRTRWSVEHLDESTVRRLIAELRPAR